MRDNSAVYPHMGHIIETEVRTQKIPISDFARKINTERRNVYDIFNRTSIDTELLLKICIALGKDLFAEYSKFLKENTKDQINSK